MDWLDIKYVNLVSSRLRNFRRKSDQLFNFSCPFCGDSSTKKSKARGYIYDQKGKGLYHCHNCTVTYSIPRFLKHLDHNIHNEYRLERLREAKDERQIELEKFTAKLKTPKFRKSGPLAGLKKISQLSPDDPVKKFVVKRLIPTRFHAELFKCPTFMEFTNSLIPDKFEEKALVHDETRLLIPFFDKEKNVFGYQGRSLKKDSEVKYITIILDENKPKIYGLDRIQDDKPFFVFEGPIDSLFIPNSVASAGGDIISSTATALNMKNGTIVYDNERRSPQTVKKIAKALNQEFSVCIWPDWFEHKDVNDAVMAGLEPDYIKQIIQQNTYRGLAAKLALQKWKRV